MAASQHKSRWPLGLILGLPVILLAIYFMLPTFLQLLTAWPPVWLERRTQRKSVHERIQSMGGLAALQTNCDALVKQYQDDGFFWHRGLTNTLPPSLAALKPWLVNIYPAQTGSKSTNQPMVMVVHMQFFGLHSTGGHSTPYYGLEVASGPGAENYVPPPGGGASDNRHFTCQKLTNGIYEIYQ